MPATNNFRMYSFYELMNRLMSPAWTVSAVKDGFIFMPAIYKNRPGRLI